MRELGTRARREQDRRVAQAREEQQRSASLVFPSHPPKPGCRRVRGHAGGVAVVTHLTGVVLFICGVAGVSSHKKIGTLLEAEFNPQQSTGAGPMTAPPLPLHGCGGVCRYIFASGPDRDWGYVGMQPRRSRNPHIPYPLSGRGPAVRNTELRNFLN